MKAAIVYATKTGHSRKLAEAIGVRLGIPVYNVKRQPEVEGLDMLLIVGGIYGGKCAPELVSFAKRMDIAKAKRALLFTSSMTGVTVLGEVKEMLLLRGVKVLNKAYCCRGSFLFMGHGHPDAEEITDAADFAESICGSNGEPEAE